MSLKNNILNYLKAKGGYVHKGEVSDYARDIGYSAENAGRRCRELENEGLIEKSLNKNREVIYKAKGGNDALQKIREIRAREAAKNVTKVSNATLF